MTWRIVVISKRSKLYLKMGYLMVRDFENKVNGIFLQDISHLIIATTEASITVSLMNELQKNKIKLIICDEKGNPAAEMLPYYNSYNTNEKIKAQILWKNNTKADIWQYIVKEKIRKQMLLLHAKNFEKASLLAEYIKEVQPLDSTNREAHAAKVYFNALFGMDFSRNDDSNANACLNYGYSIILSAVNRSIVAMGYLTQLGIFHDNMFNQFNLSCDLMEPWRILVDKEVCDMNYHVFDKKQKMQLINLLNKKVLIDGKTQYVNQAINIYCQSIIDALNENDVSLIRFPEYEL
ncbi:MAG: type II CRISPR-associated endonuclease Cas1 [Lactobacillus iners]|jgi:hypothetical protein|nr:type II CRISPR-associated endonuclease Cas1 [Lactobacillus iners]MCT7678353.1 type II CRISPR-associated endonuclease Cas1 [Lactobacillus iners]MCT7683310.1 type II CRISPR-associated endonuclease Cas1 [Lactobacillus iners]MCT7716060.1 type II CRISPR-associated endonuclease Cas1 [Lactobacillus iners]MCT7739240.1 type II CRISPR-associated endonuclease Cas1 [Lactobacillus iners]